MKFLKTLLFVVGFATAAQAQNKGASNPNLVYVDKHGVLRYTKTDAEAAFFGVNYTVPFAYGYRSHKALGVDLEKAIDADVYHFARLGLDAFRVHVWDTEISDSMGNLKDNAHLKLFDYLLYKLEQRGINVLLTPLAFWGNGYPEPDEKTGSFSSIWNKQQVLVTEAAIKAQENYLQQFLTHVNPYTKKTYTSDANIIALEINNEPHHTGTQQQAADYIKRMAKAVKSSGWTKPVFYNISESPVYAGAVANAPVDGVSFQWYPTGLVSGHELKGNFLPNVDVYRIPFDAIPAFKNKARMVYEFDAGDVLQSYMYPAMARSFRTAGFQWATQFAYDPMATAYANTEYQTHYLNLVYTPSKAISLMIAAKAFHQLPRLQSYGAYPADSVFQNFRVSYEKALSEMNGDTAFYYSNSTTTQPKAVSKLQHIAGVGSSPIVGYSGSGAYFLDRLSDGVWRLEVLPDAISVRDPFEKAAPQKEVTRVEWNIDTMQINLPDLAQNFFISPLNVGNAFQTTAISNRFSIRPGTYVISNKKEYGVLKKFMNNAIQLSEFAAPAPVATDVFVTHLPSSEIAAGKPYPIEASIVGLDTNVDVRVEVRHSNNTWRTVPMQKAAANKYVAELPVEMQAHGVLNYHIMVRKKDTTSTFPGGHKGDPFAWNYYYNDSYETFVMPAGASLSLFDATHDRTNLSLYNPDWKNNSVQYNTDTEPGALALQLTANKPVAEQALGFQLYVGDKIKKRADADALNQLVVKARSNKPQQLTIRLITKTGAAFAKKITLDTAMQTIHIPIADLKKDSMLLLPRPYPGFMPLYFKSSNTETLAINNLDKLQVSVEPTATSNEPIVVAVQAVWLQAKK